MVATLWHRKFLRTEKQSWAVICRDFIHTCANMFIYNYGGSLWVFWSWGIEHAQRVYVMWICV